MNRQDLIQSLQSLRSKLLNAERLETEFAEAERIWEEIYDRKLTALETFDKENKENYILAKAGPEPEKPKGISGGLFRAKGEEYEKALAEYHLKVEEAEKAYFQEYAEQREKLEAEEKEAIDSERYEAGSRFDAARDALAAVKDELENDDTLSERLKQPEIIDVLIMYLEDLRADSIKEAVNLYFEDLHRYRMEAYMKEQIRLTSEALGKAQEAREIAEAAEARAEEALKIAVRADKDADYAKFWTDYEYFTRKKS